MKRRFEGLSDPGLIRTVNQDYYYTDPDERFFVVADGMGGHAGGQEASQIATDAIRAYLEKHWDSDAGSDVLLKGAIAWANDLIIDDQQTHPERADMGTTAVVVLFRQGKTWCAHVGDSRLYRLRDTKLEQITEDHTWVARALKAGDMTADEARSHPWRHVLSQCLGRKELHKIEIQELDVQTGDRLLLCSDGLTEEVPDEIIADKLYSGDDCFQIAEALVEAAKVNGGSDNITVVIICQG
ncbi:Stp1/IreP family PP2C-type Ser/Thr phosphatase [Oscillatoria salina]|uniref:Stp1/IreP family PP2C-type Ser/Thr phosphatase n=1 Tax=Oscillatoria salina TaxID=331517 RepID=UPI0013BCD9F0|nr:Stp1/IreP family PP2C-type Ser/Thr phosphatase [Oscillatoria salina]MBZ8179076.1 Stp1/IreP family PP2C-type Ser/Thr phosphatase [Oscillatoria salina IIICB1]NET88812.1 Stp1/IreP family PP2C-type Ser/Thr phosphatase [Kamptonema sp. SIO1D9]